jgi:hypothetical protein
MHVVIDVPDMFYPHVKRQVVLGEVAILTTWIAILPIIPFRWSDTIYSVIDKLAPGLCLAYLRRFCATIGTVHCYEYSELLTR